MYTHLPDWMPPRKIEGIAEEGTTFVWSAQNGLRVFENGEEIPKVVTVQFDGTNAENQTAIVQHFLPNGAVVARHLERPYTSAYEKGFPDA